MNSDEENEKLDNQRSPTMTINFIGDSVNDDDDDDGGGGVTIGADSELKVKQYAPKTACQSE